MPQRVGLPPKEGRYISHSQAGTWTNCEMQWFYNYKEGWIPKEPQRPLVAGDFFHGLFDIYYQLRGQTDDPFELWEYMEPIIMERMAPDASNGELIERALKMLHRYIHMYAPIQDEGMEILAPEYYFEVKQESPKGIPFTIEGYVDLFYKNKHGLLIVRDHKTSESGKFWTPQQAKDDQQQSVYIACLRLLGYDIWRGELNFLNSFPYKDWTKTPTEKLFRTIPTLRQQDELDASLLWLGKMIDRQETTDEYQFRRNKSCAYCPYDHPCSLRFRGKDDSTILRLGFRKKDGWSEWHAADYQKDQDALATD